MNILIPDSWLREFLDTKATPKQLKDCLSLCGPSIERINTVGNDIVYDIEITSNRVDMASVVGIAREGAAILPRFDIQATLMTPSIDPDITVQNEALPLTIIDEKKLCNRLLAVVMDNVSVTPAPDHIRDRLEKSGIRALNSLVDITNYVMTELGHPSHVFDYDRIKTNRFIIRNAKKGEEIVTLDKKKYDLHEEDIIIDDGTGRVIDLPGIMGTENSVVTADTKRIIFFIESNNPVAIRKSSMRYGIRTVAATINEKHPDPELAKTTLLRGIQLYQEIAGARVRSKIIDMYPHKTKPKTVTTSTSFLTQRLGVELPQKEMVNILETLAFQVKTNQEELSILPPTFRQFDVQIPEDIVEEVARIYGYHNLAGKLMSGDIPVTEKPPILPLEQKIKTMLKHWGFTEIYTYSFISKELIEKTGLSTNDHLKIKNPLTEEIEYMRASHVPSMLDTVGKNQHMREHLSLFELSNRYIPGKNELPEEKSILIIATTHGYQTLKGIVESLLEEVGFSDYLLQKYPHQYFHPKKSAAIFKNTMRCALLGVIHPSTMAAFGIKKEVALAAIRVKELALFAQSAKRYVSIAQSPPVIEDITFTLLPQTQVGDMINMIKALDPCIQKVEMIDSYQGDITVRVIYQNREKNLSGDEVGQIRKKILAAVQNTYHATLKI